MPSWTLGRSSPLRHHHMGSQPPGMKAEVENAPVLLEGTECGGRVLIDHRHPRSPPLTPGLVPRAGGRCRWPGGRFAVVGQVEEGEEDEGRAS